MKNQQFYLLIFFGLLTGVSATQAQPTVALNTTSRSGQSATTKTAPRNSKATESPFYIKAYGFYSLLTPGTEINYSAAQSQSNSPTIYTPINTHLGQGPRVGIGLGLIASDFINIGIDADVLFGTALKRTTDVFTGGPNRFVASGTTTLNVLSIIPNVTFKALSRPAYYIYNRLGLVGGIVLDYKTVSNIVESYPNVASTTSISTSTSTKNSLAIGYQAALGIQFRLSQAIRGFVEVVAYNQSFRPKEIQNTTVSTKSGVSKTQNTTTDYKSQGDFNKSDPYEQPSFNVAINSVGVGAGLAFRF